MGGREGARTQATSRVQERERGRDFLLLFASLIVVLLCVTWCVTVNTLNSVQPLTLGISNENRKFPGNPDYTHENREYRILSCP